MHDHAFIGLFIILLLLLIQKEFALSVCALAKDGMHIQIRTQKKEETTTWDLLGQTNISQLLFILLFLPSFYVVVGFLYVLLYMYRNTEKETCTSLMMFLMS